MSGGLFSGATSPASLGLFRIAYAAFYFWHLSFIQAGLVAEFPVESWKPIWLYESLLDRPPAWLPPLAESILAGLLVLLLFGFRTRVVTTLVFAIGFLLDGFLQSMGKVEHGTVFLTTYLPLLMTFSCWGDAYSLDRVRYQRAPGPDPAQSPANETWPMLTILTLLAFLYATAGLSKWLFGTWLSDTWVVQKVVVNAYERNVAIGVAPAPIADWMVHSAILNQVLRFAIPLFECLFFLVLLGGQFRRVYVPTAVGFHAVNALLLSVTFTPILVVYGITVDWETAATRVRHIVPGSWRRSFRPVSSIVLLSAFAVAIDWNLVGIVRAAVNLGGLLDWRTIWIPALILAIALAANRSSRGERR